ncbi:MAG: hypothetical protein AMXMBFR7_49700 [Planctomycetota bacterium]
MGTDWVERAAGIWEWVQREGEGPKPPQDNQGFILPNGGSQFWDGGASGVWAFSDKSAFQRWYRTERMGQVGITNRGEDGWAIKDDLIAQRAMAKFVESALAAQSQGQIDAYNQMLAQSSDVLGFRVNSIETLNEQKIDEVLDTIESFEIIGDVVAIVRKPQDGMSYLGLLPLVSYLKNAGKINDAVKARKAGTTANKAVEVTAEASSMAGKAGRIPGIALTPRQIEEFANTTRKHYKTNIIGNADKLVGDKFAQFVGGLGGSQILLRKDATRYEFWHELGHARHFEEVRANLKSGQNLIEVWNNIPKPIKEQHAYDFLRKYHWENLNPAEQAHAMEYLIQSGGSIIRGR